MNLNIHHIYGCCLTIIYFFPYSLCVCCVASQRKEKEFLLSQVECEHHMREKDRRLMETDIEAVEQARQAERDRERMSLADRLVAAKRAHELDLIEHRRKLEAIHQDIEARRLDRLDVLEYQASEGERRRKSVCYRLDSWRQQRMQEEKEAARRRVEAEEEARLRGMDHEDTQAARRREIEERNESLRLGRMKVY